MSRVKILNMLMLPVLFCGCSLLDPYIDRRRQPGTGDPEKIYTGASKPNAPAVCYNPFVSNDTELQELADKECLRHQTGTRAEFVKKQTFACKILLPSLNSYKCIK